MTYNFAMFLNMHFYTVDYEINRCSQHRRKEHTGQQSVENISYASVLNRHSQAVFSVFAEYEIHRFRHNKQPKWKQPLPEAAQSAHLALGNDTTACLEQ